MNKKKIGIFLSMTFSINWFMAAVFIGLGGKWNTTSSFVFAAAYMFVPMFCTIIVQKFIYKEPLKEPMGISFKLNRYFVLAWLLPVAMSFAAFAVALLFPGVFYSPDMAGMFEKYKDLLTPEQIQQMKSSIEAAPIHPVLLTLPQVLIAGITVNAVAGFGEELGWRGFLQKEFEKLGFWKSSILTGVIWGIWHAPIILQGHNYPGHPLAGVFMMTIMSTMFAPVFSYVRIKAKSVIAAAIAHGSLNASVGLSFMLLKGGNDLIIGMTGLAGFIVLAIVNLCIFMFDRSISKESSLGV